MKSLDNTVSSKLRNLAFLCSGLVVLLHSYDLGSKCESCGIWSVNAFVQEFLSQGVTRCAVPFFFVCSGYFLFRNFELSFKWARVKLGKRFYSLFVPYSCWCFFSMFTITLFILSYNVIRQNPFVLNTILDKELFFTKLLSFFGLKGEQPSVHLWYLRRLMVYVVLSPLIGGVIIKLRCWFIAFLVIMAASTVFVPQEWALYRACFDVPILCFAVGGYLIIHEVPLAVNLRFSTKCLLIIAWLGVVGFHTVCSLSLRSAYIGAAINKLMCLQGVFVLWCSYDLFKNVFLIIPEKVLHYSFFIYCFHIPLLGFIRLGLTKCGASGLLLYFLVAIVVFSVSLTTGILLRAWTPKLYNVLSGGR